MLHRIGSRRSALLAGIVSACLLGACQPVPHQQFTVVEAGSGPIALRLLSGNGRYVVVDATGPTATVPGAGTWRVDRQGGPAVPLPGAATRISSDGTRILLASGALWHDGVTWSPPGNAAWSPDLRAVVHGTGDDGPVISRLVATGAERSVDDLAPAPADTTSVVPTGVSDDGGTVAYGVLSPTDPSKRVVDLDTGVVHIHPYNSDTFVLAGGGQRFARLRPTSTLGTGWVELVDVATGTVVAHHDLPADADQYLVPHLTRIATSGDVVWVALERSGSGAVCLSEVWWATCVLASTLTAVHAGGARTFDTGPFATTSVDATPSARFLAVTKARIPMVNDPRGPVMVLDWLASDDGVEALSAAPTYTETQALLCLWAFRQPAAPCTAPEYSADGHLSDDGRLVATTSLHRGWYEYAHQP